ncbi:hypothetical protein RUM44_013909 [Polyplax serrata]|uniref:Protein HGH1 homolog n=1 Tax=Polyplax serrata TaxID=468196 RepID=A0ABR1BJ51_POLSC
MESSDLQVLSDFLHNDAREDVKTVALHEVLGLTGSGEGCSLITENKMIVQLIVTCSLHPNEIISKTACLALVNISASKSGADQLLNLFSANKELMTNLFSHIMNSGSKLADAACMILSNLTRSSSGTALTLRHMAESKYSAADFIDVFLKPKYNTKGCNLNYLAPFFSNLSQSIDFRRSLMQEDTCLVKKLLPFVQFNDSLVRRGGVVGTLKNCCFETDHHEWLLSPEVDILPFLLLPLAGPEEFDEEDNEKLPLDLQYLEQEKQRETDIDIRKMLLEALLQLCATKYGREYFRSKNAYVILREYHKWENNKSVLLACENIIDILIRTEDEINENNLKELEVPKEYEKKFEEMDEQYLQDS